LPKILNALNSGVKCHALEIILQSIDGTANVEVVIKTELFNKVGNEGCCGLALPGVATKAERSEELHDGTGSQLRVCGVGVVGTKASIDVLGITCFRRGSDKCFTLISKEDNNKNREQVLLFGLKNCLRITSGSGVVAWVKEFSEVLCTGCGFKT
jgi:hypothetical protein